MALKIKWILLFCALLLLIILPFVLFEDVFNELTTNALNSAKTTYFGAPIIIGLLAADVFLPIPSSILSVSSGALYGFFIGTIVTWIGMTLGCFIGYRVGKTAGVLAVKKYIGEQEIRKLELIFRKYGIMMLVITRAVPVLAEGSTIIAGMSGISLSKFILITSLSNFGISMVYAAVGSYVSDTASFLLVFVAAIIIPAFFILFSRIIQSRLD